MRAQPKESVPNGNPPNAGMDHHKYDRSPAINESTTIRDLVNEFANDIYVRGAEHYVNLDDLIEQFLDDLDKFIAATVVNNRCLVVHYNTGVDL